MTCSDCKKSCTACIMVGGEITCWPCYDHQRPGLMDVPGSKEDAAIEKLLDRRLPTDFSLTERGAIARRLLWARKEKPLKRRITCPLKK